MTFAAVIIFILALCVLILVHEFGHFFAAKLFGIRVDEFAIGFPPRIAAVRAGETEYSVNILLFGGFVRIHGEQVSEEEQAYDRRNFAHRSRFIQAAVVVAGIVMNFVLAWVLLSTVYMIGMPTEVGAENGAALRNVKLAIVYVMPQSPADKAGIEPNDVVTSIQTATTTLAQPANADAAQQFVASHPDSSLVVRIARGSEEKDFIVRPQTGVLVDDPSRKAIGVEFDDVGTLYLDPAHAFVHGAALTWEETKNVAQGLGTFVSQLFVGRADLSQVAGPIGITKAGGEAAMAGWNEFLFFVALISINLGIINILPIPGLDGGRLLFILIESVRRRSLPEQLSTRVTIAGFAFLVLLMVAVTYHDIIQYL